MTRIEQLRMMEAAAQLCETDNLAEAEALRLVWLMHRDFPDNKRTPEPQLSLLASRETNVR